MSSAQEQYTNEMKKRFGYYATWNPGLPLSLGDFGVLEGNIFRKISNLTEINLNFEIEEDPNESDLEHNSHGNISIKTKVAGSASIPNSSLSINDAGLIIEFGKENSTLFKATHTVSPTIKDVLKIGATIIKLFKAGKWDKNWVVITELVVAKTSTIIISNSSNGLIELKANANVDAVSFDLADAAFNFSVSSSRGLETKIISGSGLTPLFRIMGIKAFPLTQTKFTAKSVRPIDMVIPETASEETIFFGLISDDPRE